MSIWKKTKSVAELNEMCQGTIHDSLEIKFEEVGEDRLSATMPVSELTRQPFGLLHGGASVVLAESLGSMASFLAIDDGAMLNHCASTNGCQPSFLLVL